MILISGFSPLKRLMQGLYYPAVLGAGIVLLLYRVTKEGWSYSLFTDISVYFALLFSVFFSISFLINEMTSDEQYGAPAFATDMAEVVLVFLGYYFLGLFDTEAKIPPQPYLFGVYLGILLVICLQNLWNFFFGHFDKALWIMSGLVGVIVLVAAVWGQHVGVDWIDWTVLERIPFR